jgi:hypothetical protein
MAVDCTESQDDNLSRQDQENPPRSLEDKGARSDEHTCSVDEPTTFLHAILRGMLSYRNYDWLLPA